ncbi:hypothetical protein DL770_010952 [Monosporascus sp. CRB-9-2]|nr:hypothetical protein DL770_010952 [Monosporascus sp. CRB-9-2]
MSRTKRYQKFQKKKPKAKALQAAEGDEVTTKLQDIQEGDVEIAEAADGDEITSKKPKKGKKNRKEQPSEDTETTETSTQDAGSASKKRKHEDDDAAEEEASQQATSKESSNKPSKKRKKSKTTSASTPAAPITTADDAEQTDAEEADPDATSKKNNRFIVFVGNLPYSATQADIASHFAAVHPTSIRLLHSRTDPRKSRGIAFVEFARYDHMKTCLKTLHHSTMRVGAAAPDGKQGRGGKGGKGQKGEEGQDEFEERKINVELTAGGGGNTGHRRDKIRAKNAKLNEERARRAAAEAQERAAKKQKKLNEGGKDEGENKEEADIHPSRRGQVPT